jgi:hypothetical protein
MCKAKTQKTPTKRKGSDKRRDSPEYWEQRLLNCKLGMDRGRDEHLLTYGHVFGERGIDFDGVTVYGLDNKQRGERSYKRAEKKSRDKKSRR